HQHMDRRRIHNADWPQSVHHQRYGLYHLWGGHRRQHIYLFRARPNSEASPALFLTTGRQIGVLNKGWDVWDFIGLIFHKTPPYENSVLIISLTYVSHESMIKLNKSSKAILIQKPKITSKKFNNVN